MKGLGSNKVSIVIIVEIAVALTFILRCFSNTAEYTLDQSDFRQCFDGMLREFHDGYVGIQEQGAEEHDILDCSLRLVSGAYSMKVTYESFSDYYIINTNNYAGQIFAETDGSAILKYSNMRLRDGLSEVESRFWLNGGSRDSEVRLRVRYYGNGILAVKSIQIEERREYRVLVCIAMICFMIICDLIYVYFIRIDDMFTKQKKGIIIAGIAGITIFSSMTYFNDFIYRGHDMEFHLSRIVSLAKALEEFQIPQRIQFDKLNGQGYAAPLYYGEIFLVIPAILYNLYLPIQTCYQFFVVGVNLLSGIVSYWCFAEMTSDWKKGLLGAFLYTLAAYRLTCVVVRAAVGEYTALLFFPILIYGLWRVYQKEADEKICFYDYIPIILAATGIINSHVLSCEMVLLFVLLFMLINYKKTFRKNILIALLKSAVCSVLLNLWFIIPFIQSMGMNINVNNKEKINELQWSTAYLSQLLGIFHSANGSNRLASAQNEMPLSIGLSILIGIGIFIFVCIKKEEWCIQHDGNMRKATESFVLGLFALFLSSNLCRWENLIHINKQFARIAGMVQFPWRYLGVATVILVTMMVFLFQVLEEHISKNSYNGIVFVTIAAVIITEGHFTMEYVDFGEEVRLYAESDVGTNIANGEYLLQDTDKDEYMSGSAVNTPEGIECSEFHYDRNGKYYLSCNNITGEQAYADVPILAYDNYHVYTSDGKELDSEIGENNKIRILIPGYYTGEICIKYVVPVLWRVSEVISLLTLGIMIAFLVRSASKNAC